MGDISTLPTDLTWPKFKSLYAKANPSVPKGSESGAWNEYKAKHGIVGRISPGRVSPKKSPSKSPKKSPPKSPKKKSPGKRLSISAKSPLKGEKPWKGAASPVKHVPLEIHAAKKNVPAGAIIVDGFPENLVLVPTNTPLLIAENLGEKNIYMFEKEMESKNLFAVLFPKKLVELLGEGYDVPKGTGSTTKQWKIQDVNTGMYAYLVDWNHSDIRKMEQRPNPPSFWQQTDKGGVFLIWTWKKKFAHEIADVLVTRTGRALHSVYNAMPYGKLLEMTVGNWEV